MQTMYDVFYQIWSSGFGETYTAEHGDLLSLLATVCVVMCVYGLFKGFVHIGKKVTGKWLG